MQGYQANLDEGGMGDSRLGSYEDLEMVERAILLQENIVSLRERLNQERQGLNQEREASMEEIKSSAHLPTCPLSDLAGIDSGCTVHGHLSERWNSLTSTQAPNVAAQDVILHSHCDDRAGPMGDQEAKWLDFEGSYSASSTSNSADEKPCLLPTPPPATLLTGTESYMTRLLEVEDMCKQEMSRMNSVVPNLNHLNQLASDWVVESELSPSFGRFPSQLNVIAQNLGLQDEDSSRHIQALQEELKASPSELAAIGELVHNLRL